MNQRFLPLIPSRSLEPFEESVFSPISAFSRENSGIEFNEKKHLAPTVEINHSIQSMFCQVFYGEHRGTGFFVDDEEKYLLAPYHLIFPKSKHDFLDCAKDSLKLASEAKSQVSNESSDLSDAEKKQAGSSDSKLDFDLEKLEFTIIRNRDPKPLTGVIWKKAYRNIDEKSGDAESKNKKIKLLPQYEAVDLIPIVISSSESDLSGEIKISRKLIMVNPPLFIGEEVYFGGYPLSQEQYSFSKGMISSVLGDESHSTIIVIDGPVSPGHSSSPVFVKRDKIYFVGTIYSSVASISEQMHIIHKKLQSKAYPGSEVQENISEIIRMMFDNMSTGKGRAIVLSDLQNLFSEECTLLGFPKGSMDLQTSSRSRPGSVTDERRSHKKLYTVINESRCNGSLAANLLIKYVSDYADNSTKGSFQQTKMFRNTPS